MITAPTPAGGNGRLVVIALVGLCALGCLGTVWKYSRLHASTSDAVVDIRNGKSFVSARFQGASAVSVGQRAVITLKSGPSDKFTGKVDSILPDGRALILFNRDPSVSAGTPATVTVGIP
jgi:multidrug resistance efflux pump